MGIEKMDIKVTLNLDYKIENPKGGVSFLMLKTANGCVDVSKRAFSYNQKVTYMGKQYYFKEQLENEILIANMETTNCPEFYNDWWVDSKHVC